MANCEDGHHGCIWAVFLTVETSAIRGTERRVGPLAQEGRRARTPARRAVPGERLLLHRGNATEPIPPLYESWAGVNPEAAARGVDLLPGTSDRAVARETVLGTWAAEDPAAASRYLDTVPPAERTDAALATVAQALSHSAPEEAWVRAQAIRDPSLRFRSLKAAFSVLATEQPDTAQRLLASTPLEPSQAERLGELMRAVTP